MDYLTSIIIDIIGDAELGNWIVLPILGVIFFIFVAALFFLINGIFSPYRRRLRSISGIKKMGIAKKKQPAKPMGNLTQAMMPKSGKELSVIRAKLIQAGFRQENAAQNFFAIKTLLAIIFPAIVLGSARFYPEMPIRDLSFYAMGAAAVGVFGPNYVLGKFLENRQSLIRRGFPDALDLLVVCTEAGLGFDLALARIARDMQHSHPVIAHEFSIINAEIRAGVDRITALKNFAERTGMDDIEGFVALLSQSIRFGTSIGETLRIYSDDFRDKRMQLAEEAGAKMATKLIFPMVFCFFPCFFIIAIGPTILKVMATL
ncbi:MAG TPA: type II secretion system F family protein [Gammaproteobacteria bacterium]|nr:type II secretion system F family protein [Gammaproteobacteria bacterium]